MARRQIVDDVEESPPVFTPAAPQLAVALPLPSAKPQQEAAVIQKTGLFGSLNKAITVATQTSTPPPPPASAPPPATPQQTGLFGSVQQAVTIVANEAEAKAKALEQAMAAVLAAAPMPTVLSLQSLRAWSVQVKELRRTRPAVEAAMATIESFYPPKQDDGGGLFEAFKNVIGNVVEVVENSVAAQVVAAVATGGLSVVAQVALDAATGREGAMTGFVQDVVNDPVKLLKAVPGVLITETGLIGAVADVASAGGAALEGAFGKDSALGGLGGKVSDTVEAVQDAAKENPTASLTIIAGSVLAAVGVPQGMQLLRNGLAGLFGGGGASPTGEEGNTGIVPVGALSAESPSRAVRKVVIVVGAAGLAGLVGVLIHSATGADDSKKS